MKDGQESFAVRLVQATKWFNGEVMRTTFVIAPILRTAPTGFQTLFTVHGSIESERLIHVNSDGSTHRLGERRGMRKSIWFGEALMSTVECSGDTIRVLARCGSCERGPRHSIRPRHPPSSCADTAESLRRCTAKMCTPNCPPYQYKAALASPHTLWIASLTFWGVCFMISMATGKTA